jgi:hypothetical protein
MFPWINASGVSELDAKDWNSESDDWMQFHDPWNLKLSKNGKETKLVMFKERHSGARATWTKDIEKDILEFKLILDWWGKHKSCEKNYYIDIKFPKKSFLAYEVFRG